MTLKNKEGYYYIPTENILHLKMKMVLCLFFCMNEIQTPKLKRHHYRERRNPQPIMSLGAPMTPEMWVILHTTRVKFFDALIITCRNLEERAKYIYQR